jgi:hypothetical protein
MLDLEEITEAIAAGEFDGQLDAICAAAVDRVRAGLVAFPWKISLDGDEWTQESVTLGELAFAEQLCWVDDPDLGRRHPIRSEIDPRLRSDHTLALIVAHLHKAQGVSLQDATKRASAITGPEVDEMVGEYEVVRPPKDDSEAPTTSSTTA